jgi:hypothetical protein
MIRERFRDYRVLLACLAIAFFIAIVPTDASAATCGYLSGTVVRSDGTAVAGAKVDARGQNVALSTLTDAAGRFSFATLNVGEYDVSAVKDDLLASTVVELAGAGTDIRLTLSAPKPIARVVIGHSSAPPVRGSGTDLTLNQSALQHSPASTSFPNLLLQLPGAARGANGVVHINGDHGDINYIVDGVSIPQALNREVGSEFDVSNAAFVDVLEGAYPAQYGGRFAAVIDIGTRSGAGPSGYSGSVEGGSYGTINSSVEYHQPVGRGNAVFALRGSQTDRGLDPPNFDSPHNAGSDTNEFFRLTLPTTGNDYLNVTLSHSLQTFQAPNDVAGGEPASTDDNEYQNDTFAALQYRHAIGVHGVLSFGPSFKRSTILDFGDPENDFTYGEALNIANGGSPTACADALRSGVFTPTTCGYSLLGKATAVGDAFNVDYALQSPKHFVRAGGDYGATLVNKYYAVTLQPGNFLSPIFAPATPGAAYTVVDNDPNVGHTESAYLQDSWAMGHLYELDYGVRFDTYQLFSSQFHDGASQLSPRVKFTRFFGRRASVYAYYGRFFTPFSFQNVSPSAAQLLNLPLQAQVAAFDLKPQRDSDYELGGHLPLGVGDFGVRIMQKNATDLIDDAQVGVTPLHQDINYQLGRIATQTAYYQVQLARNGRFYASVNHTYSVNKGCETQLLAPCFGSPSDWTPADHEQRWGATSGVIANDARGGWFSLDGEYGSGLSSAACPPTTPGFCKYTPHIVFDVEKGFAIDPNVALTLRLTNLLNDHYYITYLNAQGNHYAAGRTINVGLTFLRP